MRSWPLKKIARTISSFLEEDVSVHGFSVDSRLVSPGDLFFALAGAQTNGHAFIGEAAAKGAKAAVVLENYGGPSHGLQLLRCRDPLQALQDLAKISLHSSLSKIIAITGSVGKTTTKEFLATLLKAKHSIALTPGNSNSKIGLPLAILNQFNLNEDAVVLEMGMTHPGDIKELIEIAPPDIAVVTSVALVHACNFNSIEDIAKAKAELFMSSQTKLGIYPADYNFGNYLETSGPCAKVSFSVQSSTSDYFLEIDGNAMVVRTPEKTAARLPLLNLTGMHNRHNFLAAAAAARAFGMEWEEISLAMPSLFLYAQRLQTIEKDGVVFIDDSYNASEISMKSALCSLPTPAHGRKKIAVLGEMLELGRFSQQCHAEVGKHALKYADQMFCLGQECAPIVECWHAAEKPVFWSLKRSEIVEALRSQLVPGDVVLLKGSRLNCLWKVLDEL